jgi:hypothetical protein
MTYISYPIDTNSAVLYQQMVDYIKLRSPQWVDADGNLDTWILQIISTAAADLRTLATTVPDTIFRYFGGTVLGIPPNPAVPALVHSTWSAIDNLGHLIPAGTTVGIRDGGGSLRGFKTTNDNSILPGLSATDIGQVLLEAIEPGSPSSNIGANGVFAELVDPLAFVQTVELIESTVGGVDAETITEYTNRLSEYMRSLSTRPILPEDYARLAMNQPGVYRAVALDGYNPNDDTYFNDRMVTISAVDNFGLDLPDETKDDLDNLMQSMREVNFEIFIIDASRTSIDVNFTGVALPNFSTAAVESDAVAAITSYLSPANWGKDPAILTSSGSKTWVDMPFVYYNEVLSILSNVTGMARITDMTMNRSGDAPARNNVALDLPAALTVPGNIDGNVTIS